MLTGTKRAHYTHTWNTLSNARRVLLVMQEKPDGDNLGSCLALYHILRAQKKIVALTAVGALAPVWDYLPGIARAFTSEEKLKKQKWDIVVTTDTCDLTYGNVAPVLERHAPGVPIINIDHHATNIFFGDVNCVDEKAAAACEVVADLLVVNHVQMNASVATCLITGILTDTGFFSNPATNERVLAVAGMLLERGAAIKKAMRSLLVNKDTAALRVWGNILERMRMHPSGMAVTVILSRDLTANQLSEDAVDGVANFLNVLGEARAICVLREDDGYIKASLRTTQPDMDVAKLAQYFGGGGHKKAAGFRFAGRLQETETGWCVV
jgi:bifunctional oligoribonuclease and PAP phosphatase NrnA